MEDDVDPAVAVEPAVVALAVALEAATGVASRSQVSAASVTPSP